MEGNRDIAFPPHVIDSYAVHISLDARDLSAQDAMFMQIELQQEREEEEKRRQEENVRKYIASRARDSPPRSSSPQKTQSFSPRSEAQLDFSAMRRWDSFAQRIQSPREKFDSVNP